MLPQQHWPRLKCLLLSELLLVLVVLECKLGVNAADSGRWHLHPVDFQCLQQLARGVNKPHHVFNANGVIFGQAMRVSLIAHDVYHGCRVGYYFVFNFD